MDNYNLILKDLNSASIKETGSLENYLSLQDRGGKEPLLLSYINNQPTDLNELTHKKYREIRDNATDAFVELMTTNLGQDNIKNMVLFMQSYLYHELLSSINNELTTSFPFPSTNNKTQDMYPLLDDETIEIYFKGGTLMKHFKDHFTENNQVDQNLNDELKSKFKISDIDMNVSINTTYFLRFNQIKYCVVKLLAKILRNLSKIFDDMYDSPNDDDLYPENFNPALIFSTTLDNNGKIQSIKFNNVRYNLYIHENINNLKIYIEKTKKEIIKFINDPNYIINSINILIYNKVILNNNFSIDRLCSYSVLVNSLKIEFMIFIITFLNKKSIAFHNILQPKIDILSIVNKNLINEEYKNINNLFYNYQVNFLDKLENKLTVFKTKDTNATNIFYDTDTTPSKQYMINSDWVRNGPTGNNIDEGSKRCDFAIANTKYVNSGSALIEFTDNEYKHYVSYNNSINVFSTSGLLSFSLIRIKHLTRLKNYLIDQSDNKIKQTMNIPAEILDISITLPYDLYKNTKLVENQFIKQYFPMEGGRKILVFDNPRNILQDLSYILFIQKTPHYPWADMKYEKRIFRIFFFILYLKIYNEPPLLYETIYNALDDILGCFNDNGDILNVGTYTTIRNTILLNDCIAEGDFNNYLSETYNFEFIYNNIYQIKPEYYPLKAFLTYIIFTTDHLMYYENIPGKTDIFKNIVKHSEKVYNIIDSNVNNNDLNFINEYKTKYFEFIKKCKNNFNLTKLYLPIV